MQTQEFHSGGGQWYAGRARSVRDRLQDDSGVFSYPREENSMLKLLLWLVLLVFCWPLALAVLVLWPFLWLLSIPFRILGIVIESMLALVFAILTLPARLLGGMR